MITATQRIRKIHALLAANGLMHSKADIIYHGFGVESTTDLTPAQMDQLIARLQDIQRKRKKPDQEIKEARSVVLRILSRMGIMDTTDPAVQYVPQDWRRVNAYLSDPRIFGKLLYEGTQEELKALAVKLRAIERKERAKAERNNWLAANN